jgi:DNA-binding NarL/FixJ family response regulator
MDRAVESRMTVKVLILEDNPVARSFLCRVVRESFSDAQQVVEAGDLESARKQVALAGGPTGLHGVDPFKLILVDLELPDGTGLELLAELSQYPATKIVTTLYSDDDHLFPALQHGADGYLLKEDRFEVLVEELQKIVRGQPPLADALPRCRRGAQRGARGRAARQQCGGGQPAPDGHRETARPRAADAARDRGAHLPEQGLHDQGDRQPDGHQVVHGQRPHQVDLQEAQRVQPRRGRGAGQQAGAGVTIAPVRARRASGH